jgi:putative nucleotidyltransferase with HDIG domain
VKSDTQDLKLLFVCVCSLLVAYFLVPARFSLHFNDFPNQYYYSAFGRNARIPVKIVGVAIDDYSLNHMPARWPWQRSVYASLLRNLDGQGARAIGFDVVLKGVSEDAQDTQVLVEALRSIKSKVVLGYDFDFKQMLPGSISEDIPQNLYLSGMLNTLQDEDSALRKSRVLCRVNNQVYYSFAVVMAGTYLGKSPAEVASSIRTVRDRRFLEYLNFEDDYFYVNYEVKQYQSSGTVPIVSFYDVLNNMDKLKAEWGADFLRDSLVLVYPAAEIRHDIHMTSLGKMPGGFVHLNGIINILSGTGVDSPGFIPCLFILASAAALFLVLRSGDFQLSLVAFAAVLFFNFVAALLLWHFHFKADFFRIILFSTLFFIGSGAYKSLEFLARLNAIKDRATIDPLRGVYTLRYFRYRLELEARRRKVYVLMVYLEHLKENTEDISVDRLKALWNRILPVLSKIHGCWATYSTDEIVGLSVEDQPRLEARMQPLKDELDDIFASLDQKVVIKACAVQFRKEWSVTEFLGALSLKARSLVAGALLIRDFQIVRPGQAASAQGAGDQAQLLDGLAEDIEEKNRQLLNLYEKLKVEHGKTKEAFYQIIMSLVNALEARDAYTQGHSQRVANYALALADKLGWQQDQKERLRKASLLHDLGKIGIPDAILHKRGQLTEEEFAVIKQHEILAVNILKPLTEIEDILPWILYHHEKWDGTGYPHGLGGDAIPLASQIIAVADVYDALTTGRDYKAAVNRADSIAILIKGKGTHFNPDLVDKFVPIISQVTP